jgi:hypothetical protein
MLLYQNKTKAADEMGAEDGTKAMWWWVMHSILDRG